MESDKNLNLGATSDLPRVANLGICKETRAKFKISSLGIFKKVNTPAYLTFNPDTPFLQFPSYKD
jgi:hypothetical protein